MSLVLHEGAVNAHKREERETNEDQEDGGKCLETRQASTEWKEWKANGGYWISLESGLNEFRSWYHYAILEPSTMVSRELHELRNIELCVLFESICDRLCGDFKLRPEFFLVVQRRSHVRDGGRKIVIGPVCAREQSGRGRHIFNRRHLHGL